MEIKTTLKLKEVYDYEKLQHLLKAHYTRGDVVEKYPTEMEQKLLKFIHKKIKSVYPEIFDGILIKDKLPVSIYGHIYYQVIEENNRNAWCWDSWDIDINSLIWGDEELLKRHIKETLSRVLEEVEEKIKEGRYSFEVEERLQALEKLRKVLK